MYRLYAMHKDGRLYVLDTMQGWVREGCGGSDWLKVKDIRHFLYTCLVDNLPDGSAPADSYIGPANTDCDSYHTYSTIDDYCEGRR